jgi:hypothetical protein
MIVPLMLLGWVLMWVSIAQHVPAKWAGVALLLGLALYGVTNVDRCVKVVAQQRGWRNLGREEDRPKWKYVMEISEAIKRDVPENAKIITPGASIVGYLTGREALMWRDIDPKTAPQHYPAKIRAMNIGYAVFPPNLYDRGERMIRELMDRGVIVPEQRVSKVGDMMITTIQVNVPAGDWRETPLVSLTPRLRELGRPTTQELAHREAKQRATEKKTRVALKEYQAEKARRFRKLQLKKDPALMEAKRRKLRRAAAAATAPAPAAAATTRPVAPAKTFP